MMVEHEVNAVAIGFCVYYSFPRAFSTDDNLVYNRIEKFSLQTTMFCSK